MNRDIYSVSRLNSEVRAVLEGSFPLLWVEGEISNLARPSSGHIYFSLKDPQAQVRCAMFRMKRQRLRFQPENGLKVLIRARVGLYEGRGEFQLIAEHMEPSGEGALRQAFEELKQRLADEGLFDPEQKREIPTLPRQIGVITSPSGAAIKDVLTVLKRRFPVIPVVIYPVSVQGKQAPDEIIDAINLINRRNECDLLILTRGGGSLEDLMAFNDEAVARAIVANTIPLISAVGHEIDFTIADFVADRRAPTPSAAAEMASPDQNEITEKLFTLERRLRIQAEQRLNRLSGRQANLQHRLSLCHPGVRLSQQQQKLDEFETRLERSSRLHLNNLKKQLVMLTTRIQALTPAHRLEQMAQRTGNLSARINQAVQVLLQRKHQQLAANAGNLNTLSPLATLERGYSITCRLTDGHVIQDATSVSTGDQVETRLAKGRLICRVESVQ